MKDNLQDFLDDININPKVQELAVLVRGRIIELVPETEEKMYKGWKSLRYGFGSNMKDQFAAIELLKKRVNLEFPRGVELHDTAGLLDGTGKKFRHIKIHSRQIAEREEIGELIKSAAARIKRQK